MSEHSFQEVFVPGRLCILGKDMISLVSLFDESSIILSSSASNCVTIQGNTLTGLESIDPTIPLLPQVPTFFPWPAQSILILFLLSYHYLPGATMVHLTTLYTLFWQVWC